MKLSVSLPEDDVATIDAYVETTGSAGCTGRRLPSLDGTLLENTTLGH